MARLKKTKTPVARPPAETAPGQAPPPIAAPKVWVVRYWVNGDALLGPANELVFGPEHEELLKKVMAGDRLFMQAWDGGTVSGKARLLVVLGTISTQVRNESYRTEERGGVFDLTTLTAPEPNEFVARIRTIQSWAWSRGVSSAGDVLAFLSLKPEPDVFPVYHVALGAT